MFEEYQMECPTCGKSFQAEHLNRRYCSELCRIKKNNVKARNVRNQKKQIDGILERNRQILSSYNKGQEVEVDVLEKSGFNFHYHTHQFKENEVHFIFCYNVGFAFVNKDKAKVKICK